MRCSRFPVVLAFAVVAIGASQLQAAGIFTTSSAFSDDASTGIDAANTYTHKIGAGEAVTVNGVGFDLLNSGTTPANFSWTIANGSKAQVGNNNGDWVPATGGVTGAGIINLLNDFTYNGGDPADQPGGVQTYTLQGLTPGQRYDTRLYVRSWDTAGSGRPIDISFDDGGDGIDVDAFPGNPLDADRPNLEGYASVHSAYYLSYDFVAQGTELDIIAAVPAGAAGDSGSLHLYGLTNQEASGGGPGPGPVQILGVTATASSELTSGSFNRVVGNIVDKGGLDTTIPDGVPGAPEGMWLNNCVGST